MSRLRTILVSSNEYLPKYAIELAITALASSGVAFEGKPDLSFGRSTLACISDVTRYRIIFLRKSDNALLRDQIGPGRTAASDLQFFEIEVGHRCLHRLWSTDNTRRGQGRNRRFDRCPLRV